jgi:hypothetical protein
LPDIGKVGEPSPFVPERRLQVLDPQDGAQQERQVNKADSQEARLERQVADIPISQIDGDRQQRHGEIELQA